MKPLEKAYKRLRELKWDEEHIFESRSTLSDIMLDLSTESYTKGMNDANEIWNK